MKIRSKNEKYSDFYHEKELKKQVFVEEPDLNINNIFIFKDIINDRENITFIRMPQVYAIESAKTGKSVESRISYSAPIKLFFMVKNQKSSIPIIQRIKEIFSSKFDQIIKPVITSFGIKEVVMKKGKKSEDIIYFYIFNDIYFRNLKHLYKFMMGLDLDLDVIKLYGKIYSVPLFNQFNFEEINNLYDFKYGMLQYLEPGSDCEIYYVE